MKLDLTVARHLIALTREANALCAPLGLEAELADQLEAAVAELASLETERRRLQRVILEGCGHLTREQIEAVLQP